MCNSADPFGLCDDGKPCPRDNQLAAIENGIKSTLANIAETALRIAADVGNAVFHVGDLFTLGGANPNESGVGSKVIAAASIGLGGFPGDEGAAEVVGKLAGETGNFKYAVRALGLDKNAASKELHALKKAAGLIGGDNVWIHTVTGDVRSQATGELIGNIRP